MSDISTQQMRCTRCGSTDSAVYFGNSCSKCEYPRPKLGDLSWYCQNNMHLHCEAEFDFDCGCGCHIVITEAWGRRKQPTKEYLEMMASKQDNRKGSEK